MKKNDILSAEHKQKIDAYLQNPNRKVIEAGHYLQHLDDLRAAKDIPTTFVSFEVLKTMLNGLSEGYSNAELLKIVPPALGAETVEIPLAVLRDLCSKWEIFANQREHNLDKAFGFTGSNGERPIWTKIQTINDQKYLTERVFLARLDAVLEDRKLTQQQAIEDVAATEGLSTETVKNAFYKHRKHYADLFKTHGIKIK